jgi:hypothetical protein
MPCVQAHHANRLSQASRSGASQSNTEDHVVRLFIRLLWCSHRIRFVKLEKRYEPRSGGLRRQIPKVLVLLHMIHINSAQESWHAAPA